MTDPNRERPRLGDLLLAAGAIDEAQLRRGLAEQARLGTPIGMTLVRLGLLEEPTLVRALASQLGMPVVSLRGKKINGEILQLISCATAQKYRCLPLLVNTDADRRVLYVGMADPSDADALAEIEAEAGLSVQPVLVAPSELEDGIHRHYQWDLSIGSLKPTPGAPAKQRDRNADTPSLPPLAPELSDSFGNLDDLDDPDSFGEFIDGSPGTPGWSEREMASAPKGPGTAEPDDPKPDAAKSPSGDPMLRAIAQLLIEKGIFTREELVERLRAISRENA